MGRFLRSTTPFGFVLLASCIVQSGSITQLEPGTTEPQHVESAMKAFVADGSIVVYAEGANISRDSILGPGVRYSPGLLESVSVQSLPLDSVVGIEAFQGQVDPVMTTFATLGGTALGVVGGAALAVAIFGSCPTFYALPSQGGVLQAEAFSYSIAPLIEGRDIDALRVLPDADGILRLEMRNEALETHYINHVELVVAEHASGVELIPDHDGAPMGVVGATQPSSAEDADGRRVRASLAQEDGLSFGSSLGHIRAATSADPMDQIHLTFPSPDADSAVVVLTLRNSLLTTVLFYDLILGAAGAKAVDWLGQDMARIGSVVELGQWFQDAMGLTVEVHDGSEWVASGRVADTGPIAWEKVGIRVPVPETDSVRVRLSFFTDAWRIDQVALALSAPVRTTTRVPAAFAGSSSRDELISMARKIEQPDEDYLVTYPGASAVLEFAIPTAPADFEHSFLLSTQGYYSEWVRPSWIKSASNAHTFRPGDETVETLMALWLAKRDAFEASFASSRIPVR